MGATAVCTRVDGRMREPGEAHLDAAELSFRGARRRALALKPRAHASADGVRLTVQAASGTMHLDMPDAKTAARWADRINNPRTRAQKYGIASASRVLMVGVHDDGFAEELRDLGVNPAVKPGPRAQFDVVLLAVREPSALSGLSAMSKRLADRGALWVLWPKGRKDLRHEEVAAAGKSAGLSQTISAAFNDELTGLRFVRARP